MAYPTLKYQPYNTSDPSLAKGYKADYGFGGSTGSDPSYFDLDSATAASEGASLGSAGAGGLGSGGTPFFNGGSVMGNIGQGMNLVGSGVSLVGMLQGMRDARKNNRLNRRNIKQQMNQAETAFNRDVARQDRTSDAIRERNERVAQMNQ